MSRTHRMNNVNTRRAAPLLAAAMLALAGCSVGTPTATRALDTRAAAALPSAAGAPELQAGAPPALWWQAWATRGWNNWFMKRAGKTITTCASPPHAWPAPAKRASGRGARLPTVDSRRQAGRARLAAIESSDGQPHIASPVQWNAASAG